MNYSDIQKIRKLFDPFTNDKTLIITSKQQVAMFAGQCTELAKYKIYLLDKNKLANKIKNQDLVQKIKPTIIRTAKLSIEQKLIQVYNQLKIFYPTYNINVFVWYAGNIEQSGWANSIAWARFKQAQNREYGHDVIIILN